MRWAWQDWLPPWVSHQRHDGVLTGHVRSESKLDLHCTRVVKVELPRRAPRAHLVGPEIEPASNARPILVRKQRF